MTEYVHGFTGAEQARLTRMQELLNQRELEVLGLSEERSILDVGAGLGQMARLMARGSGRRVLGIERDPRQIEEARRQADAEGEGGLVELRQGDATDLPLSEAEKGSFDLVRARFLLEHVPDPESVVREMVQAARVGGRVVLVDDDHDLMRFHPHLPVVDRAWEVYWRSYGELGCDPLIGRRLPELLLGAGARPTRIESIFYGACNGMELFPAIVDNLVGVLEGAEEGLAERGLFSREQMAEALGALGEWRELPDASVWYSIPYAEGERVAPTE